MDFIRAAMIEVLKRIQPATVRQTFYQRVSKGVIEKTEAEYKSTVRLLGEMRRARDIPFGWISDATRWQRKSTTYESLSDMLEQSAQFYRRDLWSRQNVYLEIWLEKDALAGALNDVTSEYDVRLTITRGYPSISYLHDAAETIAAQGKPATCTIAAISIRQDSILLEPWKKASASSLPTLTLHSSASL